MREERNPHRKEVLTQRRMKAKGMCIGERIGE
jgi:hypothetical protein